MKQEPEQNPVFRIDLSVDELLVVFELLDQAPPPYLREADDGDPATRRGAQRSLIARGLIRVDGTGNASIAENLAAMVDLATGAGVVVRVRRWRTDEDRTVWYSPGRDRSLRVEITPHGTCTLLDLPVDDFPLLVAADMGLRSQRNRFPDFAVDMPTDAYSRFLEIIARQEAGPAATALEAAGIDGSVAAELAQALIAAPGSGNFAVIRPMPDPARSVELGIVGWLDAGAAGLVRVDTEYSSGGQPAATMAHISSASDEQLLDEVLGLLAPSAP